MRQYHLYILIALAFACTSKKESDLIKIDCSLSTLSLTIASQTQVTCTDGGSVSLTAAGGESPYTYSKDGNTYSSDPGFDGLAEGNYTFFVKDKNGCTAFTSGGITTDPSGITASATVTATGCQTEVGSIVLTASGGVEPYTYKLGDGNFQEGTTFDQLSSGDYTATVQDAIGCQTQVIAKVETGVSLSSQILPIIEANCSITGCHGNNQAPLLGNKANVISFATTIKRRTGDGSMPPAGQTDLTSEQIALIACWVDDGAKDN